MGIRAPWSHSPHSATHPLAAVPMAAAYRTVVALMPSRADPTRKRRYAAGLCGDCGLWPLYNTTRCLRCREKHRKQVALRRYANRLAGLCSDCSEPAIEGKALCISHLLTHGISLRLRYWHRKALGICPHCRAKAAPGHVKCWDHVLISRRNARRSRERQGGVSANVTQVRRRKAGLCPHCGGPPRAGRWLCENCAQRSYISSSQVDYVSADAG